MRNGSANTENYTERARINVNNSFELYDNENVRTLSTNTVSNGADLEGLLYVPDLDPSDPCGNASRPYIPSNATRKADLPGPKNPFIAFAPWISASCMKSYLAAASSAQAFITYLPDNGVTTPPPANDEAWDLHDGGQWKAQNKFPVYAIPGSEGALVMAQMGQYSSGSSNASIADMLAQEKLDPTDLVRLYASFGTQDSSNLPTLWAFLLIVLGLVLFIVGATSFLMHWVQRRRRLDLQRRIENGEVDLETLGVKRLRITQEAIDSLPTFIYTESEVTSSPMQAELTDITLNNPTSQPATGLPVPDPSRWSQTTCPICLENFKTKSLETNGSTVRSLPCHHIYHPGCIDPFLLNNSSLCPVCKATVLSPESKHYISEPVTNVMVRQERRARRIRQAREAERSPPTSTLGEEDGNGRRFGRFRRGQSMRIVSAPSQNIRTPTTSQIEMGRIERREVSGQAPTSSAAEGIPEEEPPPTDSPLRRDWIRRRRSTLAGQDRNLSDEETERLARRPRCE